MKTSSKVVRLLAQTTVAVIALTAAAQAQETIKLGFTGALTGPYNEFGEGIRRGATLAIEEWNKAGGLNGKKAELAEALDDQLVPDRAVQNMRRILDNKEIAGIIAPSGSGPTLAIVDMVVADGRPMCNSQAQTPAIVYPDGKDKPPRKNVFSVSISNSVESEKFARVLGEKYKSIGMLHESTGYGVTGAEIVKKSLATVKPDAKLAVESYNQRVQDVTAQLVRLQRAGVEAVLVVGLGADLAVIRKNMNRLNMSIPLYGTAGALTTPYIEGAGDLVVGTRGINTVSLTEKPRKPAVEKFLNLYLAKFGADRWYGADKERPQLSLGTTVASGYDCANLLLDAIKRAGTTEPEAVIKAMNETKNFPGASITSISFSPSEHTALKDGDLGVYTLKKNDSGIVFERLED